MKSKSILAILMILAAALSRLVPHAPNFTAVGATALFAGSIWGFSSLALVVPLAALLLSDVVLGFHSGMPFIYGAFVLNIAMGAWLLRRRSPARIAVVAFLACVQFFAVSNLGVWLGSSVYPQTPAGLVDCYLMAVPFFNNELFGDLLFSGVLFGLYALAERAVARSSSKI